MMSSKVRARTPFLAALATAVCGIAIAAVVPRDLPKQLELIKAHQGGAVIYGAITDSSVTMIEGSDHPWTRLTVKVEQVLAGEDIPAEITVYSPGSIDNLLSISPPEEETRVGEKVVMFLSANPVIQAHEEGALKIDSFAEVYRTQKNRKGEVVVLGEGPNFAVPSNTRLAQLATDVKTAYDALVKASSKDDK